MSGFGNLSPNNVLGQSARNRKALTVFNAPDTDSRLIKITNGDTTVTPNLFHDHTRYEYIAPVGNSIAVNFYAPINTEDKGLHWLVLDNSNNTVDKDFTFDSAYVFLDDLGVQTYTVSSGEKLVFFGCYTDGKLNFRVASESTN